MENSLRKRIRLVVCMFVFSMIGVGYAQVTQQVVDIDLWSDGLPNTNGVDHLPADESQQNYKPSIRIYFPAEEARNGRVVVACPGGGYHGLAYGHEGYDWGEWFNKQGITYIVLKYRMPKGGHKEVPFSDVEETLRLVKSHAEEWKINPNDIGIMGSSAGGHLASTIATKVKPELKPAFQILFYPVITMDKSYTHMGSHDNLLGKDASKELEDLYSNEKQVTESTPRAFIVFSHDDDVVSTINGVNYYTALKEKGVSASLYIYPTGGHGWGINDNFPYKTQMLGELEAWLKSF